MVHYLRVRVKYLRFIAIIALFIVLTGANPQLARAQNPVAEILSPRTGETLLGNVTILGTATAPNFARYKVEFAPQSADSVNWFLIGEVTQQVTNSPLAQWDTSTVEDGLYQVRLRLILRDGTVVQTLVTGLIVQNRVPTALPLAATLLDTTPTLTPTAEFTLTPVVIQPPPDQPSPTAPPTLVIAETALPTLALVSGSASGNNNDAGSGSLWSAVLQACFGGAQFAVIGFILFLGYRLIWTQYQKWSRR